MEPADTITTYTYDIYGRRLSKTVNGTETRFFWEGDNLAYDIDPITDEPIRRYLFENGKDDLQAYVEFSEVIDDDWFNYQKFGWYSYKKDQVGTIYQVYDHHNETYSESRTYDVFGKLISKTGNSGCRFGFQSKYYDEESGLNYFYHRYYYPEVGRFINEDPIGFKGGLNLYGFVGGNGINHLDRFGHLFTRAGLAGIYWHPDKSDMNSILNKKGLPSLGPLDDAFMEPYGVITGYCVCEEGKWYPRFVYLLFFKIHFWAQTKKDLSFGFAHELDHWYKHLSLYEKHLKHMKQMEKNMSFPDKQSCIDYVQTISEKFQSEHIRVDSIFSLFEALVN